MVFCSGSVEFGPSRSTIDAMVIVVDPAMLVGFANYLIVIWAENGEGAFFK